MLREAALAHLARYATTRAGLLRVLDRRIDRAARAGTEAPEAPEAIAAARAAARRVADQLEREAVLDDAGFAARRGAALLRAGRSPRGVAAMLRAKGIARPEIPATEDEVLAAALVLARRRRLPPFGPPPEDPRRALAAFARAGFPREVATRALGTAREEAEARIHAFRER